MIANNCPTLAGDVGRADAWNLSDREQYKFHLSVILFYMENQLEGTGKKSQLSGKKRISRRADLLVNWHWLILALAVPFFGLPSPWPIVSIFVVTLVWVVLWTSGAKPLVETPLNVPILILAVMILVSALVTYDLRISIGFVAGAVLGLAAYLTVVRYARTSKGWWICFFLFVTANVLLTVAVTLMVEWTTNKIDLLTPIISRLSEPLVTISLFPRKPHPNIIPVFLLAVLPILLVFSVSFLLKRKGWVEIIGPKRTNGMTVLMISLLALGGLDLLLSQSRGGYIAFAATCMILLLASLPGRGRWLLLIGLAMIALVLISQWRNGNLAALQENYQETIMNDSAFSLDSFEGRIKLWERALYGIQDFPLTGMGMGTFGHVMPVLYPLTGVNPDGIPLNAHNTYLQAALDLGLPGLISLLWVQIASLWMLFKSWRMVNKWQDDPIVHKGFPAILGSSFLARPVLLGLGGVYGAYLLFGMIESFSLGVYILNWMLTGLIVAFHLQARNLQDGEGSASAWHATGRGDEQNLKGSPAGDQ